MKRVFFPIVFRLLPVVAGLVVVSKAGAQSGEPLKPWLPPSMEHPAKLSPDRYVADEYPAVTIDEEGRLWVAWSSCRPDTDDWPADNPNTQAWEWPDDGRDSIIVRSFDGKQWSEEVVVSALPGVNHRPSIVAETGGIRVLWTSRRKGRWAAFERRLSEGEWLPESPLPEGDDVVQVSGFRLSDGSVLAITRRSAGARIELSSRRFAGGRWQKSEQLDARQGRCFRPDVLALPGGRWITAWDEEREGNYDVYVRASGGALERITTSGLWDTAPTLARTPDGRVWLAWERRAPVGGRFTYQGRSIFGKTLAGGGWEWAPSPFPDADPGRLTRHSRFWAADGHSEERFPKLVARRNGELWLLWLGGGRMSSVSLSGRVLAKGQWSSPQLIFHDPTPYTAFQLPSVRGSQQQRATGQGPYQNPLANQMAYALREPDGELWMAYQVPKRRHITDRGWNWKVLQRPSGYGSDIYSHRADLSQRETRFQQVVEDLSPLPALRPPAYRNGAPQTIQVGGKQYRLVWGDLHGHTENDAIGAFDMYYAQGLLVNGLDFVACTNHDFTPDFLTQSEWAEIQMLAGTYNRIPRRVAFSGWEWTTMEQDERGGHRTMYFLTDDGPLHRSTTTASNTVAKLFQLLRGRDVILQPHHNNWTGYDPILQPIFEITSAWRESREETAELKKEGPVSAVWEALERGYRIGFVGSGDTHWLGPGQDFGLTGAYVEELSRKGLFEAIRGKRVVATTGNRLQVDFRVNDAFIGAEIEASAPVRIQAQVLGDSEVEMLEIIKDRRVIYATPGRGPAKRIEYLDQSHPSPERRFSYYYLRFKQKGGMMAWTSPIWVAWR